VERLSANLDWMNGKSAMINGRTGTVKSCGPPDSCCRLFFNEQESTAVPATEAAKGVLSILVARLPAQGRTVWPVARPARLPAEARLSRQAGQLARIIESGSGGVHLLAAETNLRTSHEKALPLCDKSADSATKNTTQSSAAAGAPSARPSSDHGVVNPDRVLTDWRRGVNREERPRTPSYRKVIRSRARWPRQWRRRVHDRF